MASKSLGTLTLDLIAKIGGFTAPMEQAERNARKNAKGIKDSANEASAAWSDLGKVAAGAFAGLSIAGLFSRFVDETRAAEQEQAQLAAVLKSTGQAAGLSRDQLNEMADAMEGASTFSGGDINQAQTALLAFTGIIDKQFTRALQSAMDMAARTGSTVQQAAETIGRALDVPSKGLSALSKQGFRFTEDQKALAAELEATGRTAEAQGIILDALEQTYGGAAEAARDTFGGALAALQNTISGLLTGEGSLDSAKAVVNSLNEALASPAAKTAVDALTVSVVALSAVMASRLTASAVGAAASFALAQKEAMRYQATLASMAGISSRAAIGIAAAGAAARAASGAMALLGGPVGAALLAASAIAYFATSASAAEKEADALDARINKLDASFGSLTANQATAAIQDYAAKLKDAEFAASTVEARVFTLNDNIARFPGSPKQEQWRKELVQAKADLDTATQAVDGYRAKIEQLNGVINETSLAPAAAAASEVYTDLSKKIDEQILLVDKRTNADKLAARISAGLVEGLKAGEGELLVSKQKQLDAAELAVAAERDREAATKSAARQAASAAKDAVKRSEDEAKVLQASIDGLSRQAEQVGWTSDAVKLYELQTKGATKAQLEQAQAALSTVSAYERQKNAIEEMNDAQEKTNSEVIGIMDSLLSEEESIKQSYERRRQLILDNTLVTGEAQAELLRKLEEKKDEDLLEINGSYWERYLAAAEDALSSFDELAGSVVENFSTQFGDAFESMVFDAESLGDAVSGMAESMARSVVNALGQMAAQWLAYQVVQMLVGKTTQASASATLVANAAATSFQAGLAAFASTAAIPIVGPVAAPAAMAAALAATAPMVAAVSTASLAGMAHDGIDAVPQTGTWLLQKGERVTTAETSAKLDRTLSSIQAGNGSAPQSVRDVNITFNQPNVQDSRDVRNANASTARQVARAIRNAQRYT